jgi:DNA-binding NarL/FixJ family response regulator
VTRPLQVMVVDSQQSFCDAMRIAIDHEPDLECVASAPSAQEALDLLAEIDPEVIVVDMELDGDGPVELAERIMVGHPERSVILMGTPRPAAMREALRVGVADFVLKDQGLDVLLQRVREAEAGKRIDEDTVAEILLGVPRPPSALTPREQEVLELLGEGLPPKQVAVKLGITANTVRGHIKLLRKKLDAQSVLEAVLVGKERGLL